jgi:hypothetical protein
VSDFTIDINGITVADLDVLLGCKIISYHGRPDGEEGEMKRKSDLDDIQWISKAMKMLGRTVRKDVSDKLTCGPYNMLLVVESLLDKKGKETVETFELVGGREFECTWGQEFEAQMEYYKIEMEEIEGIEKDILQSRRKPKKY